MRRAASGLFNWAAEAGRDYVTASPCVNLPKLDPEHPRTRVLSEDEIRSSARPRPRRPALGSPNAARSQIRVGHHAAVS
jgi:hypothetical protein